LLNLSFIPVHFIVSTILFECLSDLDLGNGTSALPTTLTELYQAAIAHFDKHHCRKIDGEFSVEAIKKLQ
jgi:hypothetical protein